jgi:RNA polymerase subunit RPABC4/transcription elongation factor Spt4
LLLEIIKLESTSVKQDDKRFSCPKCAWMLDGSEEKCPKCGDGFSGDTSFQCPICGGLVRPDSIKCPECGTGFSEDDEAMASQLEGVEYSLDEIATAAQTPSPSEGLEAPKAEEDGQGRGKEDVSAVTDRISSTFGKIVEAMKVESKPQRTQSPPPDEKLVEEIAVEPEPTTPAPAADLSTEEEAKDAQAEPEPAAPKKTKTRKLKAKPQGAKPK